MPQTFSGEKKTTLDRATERDLPLKEGRKLFVKGIGTNRAATDSRCQWLNRKVHQFWGNVCQENASEFCRLLSHRKEENW